MAIPEHTRRVVERILSAYCESTIPPQVRNQVRLSFGFRRLSVTLFEERPAFRVQDKWVKSPVAQFRMDKDSFTWRLFWANRNSKWLLHEDFLPTRDFAAALNEVEKNPHGIFWG